MHTFSLKTLSSVLCVLELNHAVETKVTPRIHYKLLVGKGPMLRWGGGREVRDQD